MKSCNRIEKLITLSDFNDLSSKEREEIACHIAKCENCSRKAKEMAGYFRFINSIHDSKPELNNAADLTNSIISSISGLRPEPKRSGFKINPNYYRIASSVLLFIMAGFYTQQSLYVNQMESSLRLTYASKNANKSLMIRYNECQKFSEDFIKGQIMADAHFFKLLIKLQEKYPLKSYRTYASAICLKSNAEFARADLEVKKRMVIEMLNSNLNQNR